MTTDRREGDDHSTPAEADDDRPESDRETGAFDGDVPSFASIFERAPTDVSTDAVVSALQTIRTGDPE